MLPAKCFLALATLTGCASSTGVKLNSQALYAAMESNAQRSFAQAVYAKPASNEQSIAQEKFAPLIIHEVSQDVLDEKTLSHFHPTATSSLLDDARLLTNEQATVYYSLGSVTINQVPYDQVLYFWFYENQHDISLVNAQLRGMRITVGLDGFPLIWEMIQWRSALINHDALNVIYVSHSGELAARSQYGKPLARRRYAIERHWPEASHTIVANLVEDGPLPMGPIIYLQSLGHEVMALHCRCSPSQADLFVEEITYELVPAETLDGFDWSAFGPPTPLDRRLRWPIGQ